MKLKLQVLLGGLLISGLAFLLTGNVANISNAADSKPSFVKENNKAALDEKVETPSDTSSICNEVSRLHDENKLKDAIVSKQISEIQLIDINNDGTQEQIKYFPTRTYMALTEIRGTQRVTIPTGTPTATYSGADIIRLNGRHYILQNVSSDTWKIHELLELADQDPSLGNPYVAKILCEFHQ